MKAITITLSDKAEKYFNEVKYSLDDGDGKVVSNSRVINESLENLSDFEERFDMDLLCFMNDDNTKPYTKGQRIQGEGDVDYYKDKDGSVSYA